jgi:hypothetical protein
MGLAVVTNFEGTYNRARRELPVFVVWIIILCRK